MTAQICSERFGQWVAGDCRVNKLPTVFAHPLSTRNIPLKTRFRPVNSETFTTDMTDSAKLADANNRAVAHSEQSNLIAKRVAPNRVSAIPVVVRQGKTHCRNFNHPCLHHVDYSAG